MILSKIIKIILFVELKNNIPKISINKLNKFIKNPVKLLQYL